MRHGHFAVVLDSPKGVHMFEHHPPRHSGTSTDSFQVGILPWFPGAATGVGALHMDGAEQ